MRKGLKALIGTIFALTIFFSINIKVQAATTRRIYGADRYKTAVAISKEGWPSGSQSAVLTTSENFPDALSAAPLAKKYDAPILLTGYDRINSDTAAELRRLKAKNVYIIGGTGVISQNVEDSLKSIISGASVTRISGADRYETAVKVASIVGTANGIIVATGEDFPDAMSAAPVAASKGMPVILVPPNSIPGSVADFIAKQKITKTYIIGDNASDEVCSNFNEVQKIGGKDKYARNVNTLKAFSGDLDFSKTYISTGEDYPDALSAAALAARTSSPVILSDSNIPWDVRELIMSNIINEICIIGGNGALDSSVDNLFKEMPAYIQSVDPISISVSEKEKCDMPKMVTCKVYSKLDGVKTVDLPVTWNLSSVDTSKAGQLTYTGKVNKYNTIATLVVIIKSVPQSVDPITAEVVQYGEYDLPSTVAVKYSDGTYEDMPVTWSTNNLSLTKVGSIPIQGVVDGTSIKVTFTLKVVAESEVKITDDTLRYIIYRKLNKRSGRALYKSELLSITSLSSIGTGTITSLSGIENLTNLTSLELQGYSIKNISQLQNLVKLESLNLSHNTITDITPLSKLVNLEYLDLSYNNIINIAPLKNLTRLNYLYLKVNSNNGTYLRDYSPVRQYYDNLSGKDFTYDGE